MIEVEGLCKRRGGRFVVRELGFRVGAGRVTAFLGPNGAGKSTTLRVLLGLDRADSGRALVRGVPYARLRWPLRVVGAVLEDGAHPARSGRGHLGWVARSNGIALSRVSEVLGVAGLSDFGGVRVGAYSLGMRRRLAVACALLGEPEVLVLDEPLNGLDPEGIRWLRRVVREFADSGGAVLLSSHLVAEAEAVADDVVVVDRGRLVASGTVAEVVGARGSLEEAFFALTGGAA
ncbi:ATP-binding cassette domain-containing protein [Actinosynnema pretiosum subsp. pretiosum]|uniref:ABC transporter related n=2 Tax=Actinosynnema TaxID=40566 RepID=C6WJX3_ACTMD|nr:ATP-binding cassette domain-containing protein [Actinosynnema mirum]ACU36348.1 ABC transporter related [Actinosynnema mirum DSM 43827]AXX29800.1 putative ABC transporter ATP-binding protein [Actinosynnema pretiosum subsp. pretiosum]QUF05991.1 ATP-binding cassette domain-containing protein [Actinosynnema pretiosum subsp. pretiosum]